MSNTLIKGKSSVKNSAKGKLSGSGKGNGKSPTLPKLPIAAIGAGFALLFGALVAFTSNRPAVTPPSIGGPFQLTAHNGQTVTDKDLLGRPFLVFFGYTHCPDVCHATLFEMSEILRALGPRARHA
jgi:protein SCO1/2